MRAEPKMYKILNALALANPIARVGLGLIVGLIAGAIIGLVIFN